MNILIDSVATSLDKNYTNLEEIICDIAINCLCPGKNIETIILNGQYYSEKTPHEAQKILSSSINTIEIHTTDNHEVFLQFLEQGNHIIKVLEASAAKIADLFRFAQKDVPKILQSYIDLLSSYQDFINMIEQSNDLFQLNLNQIIQKELSVNIMIKSMEKLLDKMVFAQEKEEWIILADLLEYEFIPLIKKWPILLCSIKKSYNLKKNSSIV